MPERRTRPGRLRRGERMAVMAYHLLGAPHRLFSLGTFVEMLSAAKSTISEDLGFMRQAFDRFRLGKVETRLPVSVVLTRLDDSYVPIERRVPEVAEAA